MDGPILDEGSPVAIIVSRAREEISHLGDDDGGNGWVGQIRRQHLPGAFQLFALYYAVRVALGSYELIWDSQDECFVFQQSECEEGRAKEAHNRRLKLSFLIVIIIIANFSWPAMWLAVVSLQRDIQ